MFSWRTGFGSNRGKIEMIVPFNPSGTGYWSLTMTTRSNSSNVADRSGNTFMSFRFGLYKRCGFNCNFTILTGPFWISKRRWIVIWKFKQLKCFLSEDFWRTCVSSTALTICLIDAPERHSVPHACRGTDLHGISLNHFWICFKTLSSSSCHTKFGAS